MLGSIYVLDSGSSSAGTLFSHSVDFLNIWDEFSSKLQHLMHVRPTTGSVCSGFYYLQYDNPRVSCLHECCQVPSGQMCVMISDLISIHIICDYKGDSE